MWRAHLRMRVNYIYRIALVNTAFVLATEFIGEFVKFYRATYIENLRCIAQLDFVIIYIFCILLQNGEKNNQNRRRKKVRRKPHEHVPEKLAGEAHTARTCTGTAPKGSGPVTAGEGENTAKPPPRNKGANKTQSSKSNTFGKRKNYGSTAGNSGGSFIFFGGHWYKWEIK